MKTTRQIRRRLAVFVTVLGLAAYAAGPVGAETTTIDVNGGTLSSTTNSISFSTVTLDGTDTTTTGNATWTVVDPTGTGAGWNITVVSTDITGLEVDGLTTRTIDIDAAGGDQDLLVSVASIAVTTGNGLPTTAVGSNTDVPFTGASALKILSAAADDGMGTFTYVPTFTLEVPAETYASNTTFGGTITVTIASGP